MENKTHTTLKPKTNILQIIVYFIASCFLSTISNPYPLALVILALALGAIGGTMQNLSFKENKPIFTKAKTALEVRSAMMSTKWGKKYFYFLWVACIILFVCAMTLTINLLLNFIICYLAFVFIRELITLKTAFEMAK